MTYLPVQCKFRLDPENKGKEGKWYSVDLDESQWQDIRIGASRESQGYDYDGYAPCVTDGRVIPHCKWSAHRVICVLKRKHNGHNVLNHANRGHREDRYMLWTIAVILLVLWLLGLVSSYTMGGFIHVLLVIAIVVVLVRIIQGR